MECCKPDTSEELLVGFHTQFAENQRANQQLFIRVVGFLGAVILGYVYVYENYSTEIIKFSLTAVTSELLLSFGAWVVAIISFNFRRDQFVNSKIREKYGLIGDDKIFPSSYNPCENFEEKGFFTWMPNLLALFYFLFPSTQTILLFSYFFELNFSAIGGNSRGIIVVCVSMLVMISLVFATFLSAIIFYYKMDKLYKKQKRLTK